jgi:demethylmenaquinone methyltransferase/2-methoxy-6-polyprenyl-1,4-benzoquinol methylase
MKWIYRHPACYDVIDSLCSLSLSDRARRDAIGGISTDSFLEIGAGSGKSFRLVGSRFKIGLDSSPNMLRHAKRRFPDTTLVIGDAHMLPFRDACIGVSVFSYCLRGLKGPVEAIEEALRVSSEVVIIDYSKPRMMPAAVWKKVINWFGWRVFGSRDLDYGLLERLGSSAGSRDLYGGLYKVIVLKGALDA